MKFPAGTRWIENKWMGKGISSKRYRKKASLAILVFDILQRKPKLDRRNKEDHQILCKETICQEDITILNVYSPNTCMVNSIKKQILLNVKS